MRFFPISVDSVLEVYAPERADSGATATIYGQGSTGIGSAISLDRDTVSTTTAGGLKRGDEIVVLQAAGDVAAGRYYRIGPLREKVKVREVSGTTIKLQFGVQREYAQGAAFVGTRLTGTLPGATFATPGTDYLARISWLVSAAARTPMDFGIAFSRHAVSAPRAFHADVGVCDVLEVLPALPKAVSYGTDWDALIARAEERVQANIEPHWKPWSLRGATSQYRECVLMRCVMEACGQLGAGGESERKYWAERYKETLDQVLASSNVDNDQDGAVESHEGGTTGIEIVRA